MNSIPPRNSKELKLPPNNINININFTMKEALAQALPQPQPAKPLAGKKIDNYVHVSSGARGEVRRANVTTQTLKDRRRELLEEQDSSNALGDTAELLKTKRLDAPAIKSTKRKQRSAKASQTHQEVVQSVFSTNKAKNKQYSRQLREAFARGGQQPQSYLHGVAPTPAKNHSGEKTRRKSAERERIKRKVSVERARAPEQWKLSKSVENLNRHKVLRGENRTPSGSKSKSSGSRGSSIKRRTLAVDSNTERHKHPGQARRSEIGVEFLNELSEDEIKHVLHRSQKSSQKKFRASEAQNHKFTEEELAHIRAYMVEKKRRIDREKREKDHQQRNRLERLRDSLNKVEVERKANASKTIGAAPAVTSRKNSSSGKKKKSSKTIISMKYADKDFDDLKEQAQKLIHEQQLRDALSNQKQTSSAKKQNSSTKKQPLVSLVEKYWKENAQPVKHSQQYLNECAIKIQKVIRGYLSRKHTLEKLRRISQRVREVEDQIDNRRKEFWGNNSHSIIQVHQDIEHSDSAIHPSREQEGTEHGSERPISINQSWEFGAHHQQVETPKDEEEDGSQDEAEQMFRMIQKLERDPRNTKNIEFAKKLRNVAEAIRKKQEDHKRIVKENMQLKMNMKGLVREEPNNNSEQHPRTFDSAERPVEDDPNFEFQIRMPVKISPPETKRPDPQPEPKEEESLLKPSTKLTFIEKKEEVNHQEREQRRREIEMFKKFKEQSDSMMKKAKKEVPVPPNSAPTVHSSLPKPPTIVVDEVNHHFEAVRSPKNQQLNIVDLLRQKERLLSTRHRLSLEEINDMYKKHLVSPRSYSRRITELEQFQEEKNAILRSIEQAEKIVNFVKSIEKDKQEVKRLEEYSKLMKSSEGGPVISKVPLGEPNLELPQADAISKLRQHKQAEYNFEDDEDEDSQHNEIFHSVKSSESEKGQKPSFMQPLPIPIEQKKIENIFRGFEEEHIERSNQNSIISIFQQASDKTTEERPAVPTKDIEAAEQQLDRLNNEMVVFVEQALDNAAVNGSIEREKPGFDTNLNLIKEYCVGMCELIKSNDRYREQFKLELTSPLKYDYLEFLGSYRRTETGEYTSQYNTFQDDLMYPFFRQCYKGQRSITQRVFEEFNSSFSVLKRNQPSATKETVQLEEIFLRAILDVFNEALDYQRPNSILGRPMPWISKSKYMKNLHLNFDSSDDEDGPEEYSKEQERLDMVFGGSIARVIQWGSALCGFIPDTVESDDGQLIHMDEDYINHIKETRLALMLEKTLTEDEDRLLEFSDEETEVKLETSSLIATALLLQFVIELRTLQNRSRQAELPVELALAESQYFEYIDD